MMQIKTFNYTWQQFDEDTKAIQSRIDFSKYDMVIGIASGGLPLLTKLVNISKLPYEVIQCQSYKKTEREEPYVGYVPTFLLNNKKLLLVDDCVDSGNTMSALIGRMKTQASSIDVLVLCYKPQSIVIPTYYIHSIGNDTWINFPWE